MRPLHLISEVHYIDWVRARGFVVDPTLCTHSVTQPSPKQSVGSGQHLTQSLSVPNQPMDVTIYPSGPPNKPTLCIVRQSGRNPPQYPLCTQRG